jgi:F0F1-type ATP synthase assembly protein I
MTEDEPRITAEHVQQAAEAVKRSYAKPYIERAMARMRSYYIASTLWAIFIGEILGQYTMHSFPWGSLAVAIVFTVIAVLVYRRNRE